MTTWNEYISWKIYFVFVTLPDVQRVQFLVKNLQNNATLKRVLASNVVVEKTISITYSKCVFVVLGTQQAMRAPCIVICGPSSCTIYFKYYLINGTKFLGGNKVTEHKMCVLILSTTSSDTFLILKIFKGYNILVRKSEGRRPLRRPRRRWVYNIRMDLQEVGCGYMDWIGLAQDRDSWRTLVSAVMNLGFREMRGIS